ncbi:MAG: hypothetical protein SWO11_06400 [Thermodesulfobacteriota bacterium]|nr:hypothetical protein [Thermodesulfobacteriota bacterium]
MRGGIVAVANGKNGTHYVLGHGAGLDVIAISAAVQLLAGHQPKSSAGAVGYRRVVPSNFKLLVIDIRFIGIYWHILTFRYIQHHF